MIAMRTPRAPLLLVLSLLGIMAVLPAIVRFGAAYAPVGDLEQSAVQTSERSNLLGEDPVRDERSLAEVLAPAGTKVWQIDAMQSTIEFSVKHMMVSTVRGRFRELSATMKVDEANPDRFSVEVEIDAASIDTGVEERDSHLRSGEFFDVDDHPTITFKSKSVEGASAAEGNRLEVIGDLTIRDTTVEITLDATFEGLRMDHLGRERAHFSAETEIDRREWGLGWNKTLETGGVLVGHNVRIELGVVIQAEANESRSGLRRRP